MNPFAKLVNWERNLRASYNTDLSTPENRRRAHIYNLWFDHAVLRKVWTNFHPVAPGVYRSNQPTHERFVKLKEMGIKSVLNLRGAGGSAHYLVEKESCDQLGLILVDVNLHARSAASRAEIQKVLAAFRSIEKPFVLHCKSGADRAGFASAMYMMVVDGKSVAEARKMLSVKFIHLKWSKTGILDHILDVFEARTAQSPIGFEDWINTEYDGPALQASFEAKGKPWF